MELQTPSTVYNFAGRSVVVTGGAGVLCTQMVRTLAGCNANVAILDRDFPLAQKLADSLSAATGKIIAVPVDVLDNARLAEARDIVLREFGAIDALINGAGGNHPKATTNPQYPFFDIPPDTLRFVFELNLLGTILPSQVFGKVMAEKKEGTILNISSMNAFRPLTRIAAYSAAKAGVSNFTQWLAVHMAQEYSPKIRVNAIAPGFFLTEQNRFLLTEKETGVLTPRGKTIISHTPLGRFGEPADLLGAVLWLLSPASAFVTGVVIPVDGGFSAFSGV
jgi:NAD(P)-dependent dehydrogenase (short-subunit alcohol dehydrogenase family)